MIAGSRGEDLDWHINRSNEYLCDHPEINLSNLLELKNLDSLTSYHYVLGGLIAMKALEKGGWSLVKNLLSCGISNSDYYLWIENSLAVKRNDLNEYLRTQLELASHK